MAFIGAVIYFVQQAATFWPAILMYKLLEYLKM
jgi:hypothetical protein